jgi:hypothetical protein
MNELKKRVSQLNPGTDLLEKILEGVPTVHLKSVGFDHKFLNKLQHSQDTKFSLAEEVLDLYIGKRMPQHPTQHPVIYPIPKSFQHHSVQSQKSQHHSPHPGTYSISKSFQHHKYQKHKNKKIPKSWVCHHCGERGHIRPFCFKLHGYPEWYNETGTTSSVPNKKKEWKTKSDETGLVAHATDKASSQEV